MTDSSINNTPAPVTHPGTNPTRFLLFGVAAVLLLLAGFAAGVVHYDEQLQHILHPDQKQTLDMSGHLKEVRNLKAHDAIMIVQVQDLQTQVEKAENGEGTSLGAHQVPATSHNFGFFIPLLTGATLTQENIKFGSGVINSYSYFNDKYLDGKYALSMVSYIYTSPSTKYVTFSAYENNGLVGYPIITDSKIGSFVNPMKIQFFYSQPYVSASDPSYEVSAFEKSTTSGYPAYLEIYLDARDPKITPAQVKAEIKKVADTVQLFEKNGQ